LPASTQTTTVQQVVTQYSTVPGNAQTITQTTVRDENTSYIERTTTAPAQTSTILVTQNGGTVTATNPAQTFYVTATSTMPAPSVYFVNDAGPRTVTKDGQTVTVAYCIATVKVCIVRGWSLPGCCLLWQGCDFLS
jgi:hypothetical protein